MLLRIFVTVVIVICVITLIRVGKKLKQEIKNHLGE